MDVYVYFISYNSYNSKGVLGCGNLEVIRTTKIKGIKDIQEIARDIVKGFEDEDEDVVKVIIMNYQLLRAEKSNSKNRNMLILN